MASLADKTVVGLGEVLWDCFADSRRPGGAPANVAFHARQFGHNGVVCSRVGDDELGRELLQYLADHGLDASAVQVDPDHPTGHVTVDTRDPGHPTYVIHENVAWDFIDADDAFERLMTEAAAVCFGTLAQRSDRSRASIQRGLALARKALIVYDVNLRQSWYDRELVERSLRGCDIVKLNSEEVAVLADLLGTGEPDPAAFARALRRRYDVHTTCVTRAENGCVLIEEDESVDLPGIEVEVADAVGAGDAFTAAMISARLRGWPLRATATIANHAGSMVAARPGAMPSIGEELAELIRHAKEADAGDE